MNKICNSFYFTIFFIVIQNNLINAQSISYENNGHSNYSLSSSEVGNLENYYLGNNDLYTGKKNINIPIYTIKTGGIEYPITLGYSAGGIKVDQRASDVGLGWNLTSAIITRTINQACDFDNTGYLELQPDYNTYSQIDKTKNIEYHTHNNGNIDNDQTHIFYDDFGQIGYFLQKQINRIVDQSNASIDKIPDTYNFYSNGASTSFFFNDVNTPVEINPKGTRIAAVASKVRIDTKRGYWIQSTQTWIPLHNFPTTDFFTIDITTNKGIKYTFSDCDYSYNEDEYFMTLGSIPPAKISAWHITKIEDLNTGKSIDFIYDNVTSSNTYGASTYPNKVYELGTQKTYNLERFPLEYDFPCQYYVYENNPNIVTRKFDVQKKRLKKIVFEEGEINFNYNNLGVSGKTQIIRSDLYNSDCVTQIEIKNKNATTVKKFELEYDYFQSNYNVGEFNPDGIFNSYRYKRLKLLSLQEVGLPKYEFSYEESIKLPTINSFSVDFAGYYNNSTDIISLNFQTSLPLSPTLYFYPTQFEKSLSPFPIPNMPIESIDLGYFNRQANDYARAWSLNKIKRPLGGTDEYTYESNEFEMNQQTIKGGGIRLQKEVIKDDKGGVRTFNYSYLKDNGISSGTLNSFPFFGHPTMLFYDGMSINYPINEQTYPTINHAGDERRYNAPGTKIFDKSNLYGDNSTGAFVGYSNVKISEAGNGRKELTFTSNNLPGFENFIFRTPATNYASLYNYTLLADQSGDIDFCMTDFLIGNSGLNSHIYTDNAYKRGKLKNEKIYDESNNLVKETIIDYTNFNVNSYNFTQTFTQPIKRNHDNDINYRFALYVAKKNINISNYLPTKKTVFNYTSSGTIDVISDFSYNAKGFLTSSENTNSNGEIEKNNYYYPQDPEMALEPNVNQFISKNTIAIPLKNESFNGSEKLFEQKTIYANDATTNYRLLPKYIRAKNGADTNTSLEIKITYDKYDEKGNLLQYTLENGIPVTIIYGYYKTLPIAKIENATYVSITQTLITNAQTASDTGTEVSLLNALTTLRTSLPNAVVTTFTYKPLVGVSTITDPNGDKIIYTYDSVGRLINVKDRNGNILSENEYHFKY